MKLDKYTHLMDASSPMEPQSGKRRFRESRVHRTAKTELANLRCLTPLFAVFVAVSACQTSKQSPSDEAALMTLHVAGLKAHIDGSIDSLLANQSDDFVLVNLGEISTPTKQERREFLGPYLETTRFETYKDRVEPIIKISPDGTLGWVVAQIEARGTAVTPEGERPVEFMAAWIELYERREGKWVSVGNSSSFKPIL